MIWLKDSKGDYITVNKVSGNREILRVLYGYLQDRSKFVKKAEYLQGGPKRLILESGLTSYRTNVFVTKDETAKEDESYIYKTTAYESPKPVSTLLIREALGYERDTDILLLNLLRDRLEEIEFLRGLSFSNPVLYKDILEKLYEDFKFFSLEVLRYLSFETINRFNIEDLYALKRLSGDKSEDTPLEANSQVALAHLDIADANTKVLDFAQETGKKLQ